MDIIFFQSGKKGNTAIEARADRLTVQDIAALKEIQSEHFNRDGMEIVESTLFTDAVAKSL